MSVGAQLTRMAQNAVSVDAAKSAIASAITAKGGTVGASDDLGDFPDAIAGIPSGGSGIAKTKIGTFRKDVNNENQSAIAAIDLPSGQTFNVLEFMPADHTVKAGKILFYKDTDTGSKNAGIMYTGGTFDAAQTAIYSVAARESAEAPIVIGYGRIGGGYYADLRGRDIDVYAWTMPFGV